METEKLEESGNEALGVNPRSGSRKILMFGAIGLASVALVIGGWVGFTELRISSLLDQTQSSLESGDLETAENALSELEEVDPENENLESLQTELDYAMRFASYEERFANDDLDGALVQLEMANQIKPSPRLESLSKQLVALQQSKADFEAGRGFLESGNYKNAYSKLAAVSQDDAVRYKDALELYDEAVDGYLASSLQEAKSKLGSNDLGAYKLASDVISEFPDAAGFSELKSQAEQAHASQVRGEAEKLVKSGFYISAFKLLDKTQSELGRASSAVRELNNWFNPIFDNAKASALKNDMVAKTDSFTGQTRYYYKPTYRSCGGFCRYVADRFNFVLIGKTSPQIYLDVMLVQDDWVFADSIKANIDGEMWTIATDSFFGDNIERDNGRGDIWEYTWRQADKSDVSYFLKARESKRTIIRFQGDGTSDFTVSSTMKLGVEKVLLAYLELGGSPSILK